ncbi:hypothetical protein [Neobacillus sp. PS2-9]|uniref:hypothetical protein n=1 Tax=Neobacillus sp. PS2-9 TaxID=3070676 RepID=UPI0027E0E42F|nr:hypothetical protein [Neobacillus sp. PS2-9]WML58790.1 hypothetical protein RCG25_03055 [Neobacillus sp. PS2-9]
MKRMPFERPTDYSDERLIKIDEQICSLFELFLGEQYDCRQDRAGGSSRHFTYNFIVSPPLPDDISKAELVFREYSDPFREKPTGLEIVMNIE